MIKRNPILIIFIPAVIGAFSGDVFNLAPNSPVPFSLFQIGLFMSIPAYFSYMLYANKTYIRLNSHIPLAIAFLAWLSFSLIYSPNHADGLFYLVRVGLLTLFTFLFFSSIASIKDVVFIGKLIVAVSLVIALFGIFTMLSNPHEIAQNITSTTDGSKNRAVGVGGDPNVFASFFIFPFFYLLNLFYSSKQIGHKALIAVGILIILAVIALTYSRSVMLAIFLGSSIIIFIKRDIKLPLLILGVFTVLLLTSETFRLLLGTVIDRIIGLFTETMDNSNLTRILLLEGAVDMVIVSYGLGIGLKGFPVYFASNFDIQETVGVYEPHNIFYQVLAEQGIIGFLLFMLLYTIIGLTAWKNYRRSANQTVKNITLSLFCSFIGLSIFFNLYAGALTDSRIYILGALIFAISFIQNSDSNIAASD